MLSVNGIAPTVPVWDEIPHAKVVPVEIGSRLADLDVREDDQRAVGHIG
jgi:hypothetical protein